MKKRIIFVWVSVMVLGLLCVWIIHVVKLNKNYVNKENETINANEAWMGQEIIANDGITYNITEAVIYDYAACMSAFSEYEWNDIESMSDLKMMADGDEVKILLYSIRLDIREGQVPPPDTVETESGFWQSVSSMYMYDYFNHDVEFIQNQSVELQIPIKLVKSSMSDEEWQRLDCENPGLQLVLCYQPEQVIYHINEVNHIYATDEDLQVMQEKMKSSVELLQRMSETEVYEENVVEQMGISQEFQYELKGLEYYDEDHPIEGEEEFCEEMLDWLKKADHYYIFVATYDVVNTSNEKIANYINSARLCAVKPDDFRVSINAEANRIYCNGEVKTGKTAGLLELNSGEQVSIRTIYCATVSDQQFQTIEELQQMNYYLVINQGREIMTLNDCGALFIRFPNGIETK